MNNFTKYAKRIKKLNYQFGVDKKTGEIDACAKRDTSIKGCHCSRCLFNRKGGCHNEDKAKWLYDEYVVTTILTKKESKYLQSIIKPFKESVCYISKLPSGTTPNYEFIRITTLDNGVKGYTHIDFPQFCKGQMYKGLSIVHKYTIEELFE